MPQKQPQKLFDEKPLNQSHSLNDLNFQGAMVTEAMQRMLGADVEVSAAKIVAVFAQKIDGQELQPPDHPQQLYQQINGADVEIVSVEHTDTELLKQAFKAFWQWAATGFGVATPEDFTRRISVCSTCAFVGKAPLKALYQTAQKFFDTDLICNACGCFIAKKARHLHQNCPLENHQKPGFSLWDEPLQAQKQALNGRQTS